MFDRIANIKLAIVVLICVLFLFFLPAARGSFSATHGPVTSGRSRVYAFLLYCSIRLASQSRLLQVRVQLHNCVAARTDTRALLELFPHALAFDLRC
jgi:hypothetical protein